MDYYLFETTGDLNDESLALVSDAILGMDLNDYKLSLGEPAAADFPSDAALHLDPDSGFELRDILGNLEGYFLASSRAVDAIRSNFADLNVEVLPFRLIDSKGRLRSSDYSFVNPLDHRDCLHEKRSQIKYDKEGAVLLIKDYVLDKTKTEGLPHLFRVDKDPGKYLFSHDFGQTLGLAGVTGLQGVLLEQA